MRTAKGKTVAGGPPLQPPYLAPGQIGPLSLKNRIVRAATSESMASAEGEVTPALHKLYGDLARGGAGLIITGHIFVEPRGQYSPHQMGIHDDALVPGLAGLVATVHEAGGTIFAELSHAGSQSTIPEITPLAPSVIPNAIVARTPVEMSEADIEAVLDAFGDGARRAREAGFDGIHIHGGNGYLLSEFASPHANRRDDGWGGDAERRDRFWLAAYERIRTAVGKEMPVTARVGIADTVEPGLSVEESVARVTRLRDLGLDAVEVSLGVMTSYLQNIRPYVGITPARALADGLIHRLFAPQVAEVYFRPYAQAVKRALDIPVILVGGVRTTDTMADVIESGDADFVALARPFIREPDLANKLTAGRRGLVDCVSCNICLGHDGTDGLRCWRKSWRSLAYHAYTRFWRDR